MTFTTWFLAVHLLTLSKNNVSALELKRHMGINYRTAWLMKHKLMQAMGGREDKRILNGQVELGDTNLGGEKRGKHGRGLANRITFVAAIQNTDDGRPAVVQLSCVPDFTKYAREGRDHWGTQRLGRWRFTKAAIYDLIECQGAGKAIVKYLSLLAGGRDASPRFQGYLLARIRE